MRGEDKESSERVSVKQKGGNGRTPDDCRLMECSETV